MAEKHLTLKFNAVGMPQVLANFTQLRQTVQGTAQTFTRIGTVMGSAMQATSVLGQFSQLSNAANAANQAIGAVSSSMMLLSVGGRAGIAGLAAGAAAFAAYTGFEAVYERQVKAAEEVLTGTIPQRIESLRARLMELRETGAFVATEIEALTAKLDNISKMPASVAQSDKLSEFQKNILPDLRARYQEEAKLLQLKATQRAGNMQDADFASRETMEFSNRNMMLGTYSRELQAMIAVRQELSSDAYHAGLISENEYLAESIKLERELAALRQADIARTEADDARKRAMQEKWLMAQKQAFDDAATAARAFGREGFLAYKAFAISSTIISTYSSAQKSYEALASIPYVGPILGGIAAAAAIAAGTARVAAIANESYSGYATGGYTGDGPRGAIVGSVHAEEFVFSAPAVDRIGLSTLEALHDGEMPPTVGQNVNVALLWSEADVRDLVTNSPQGEEWVIKTVGKNQHRFRG